MKEKNTTNINREEALEFYSASEEFNNSVKVLNSKLWFVVTISSFFLFLGFMALNFIPIDSWIDTVVIVDNGRAGAIIKEGNIQDVEMLQSQYCYICYEEYDNKDKIIDTVPGKINNPFEDTNSLDDMYRQIQKTYLYSSTENLYMVYADTQLIDGVYFGYILTGSKTIINMIFN